MIKVGCTDFPVGQKKVHQYLDFIETQAFFTKPPTVKKLQKWRSNSPNQFEFVTHAPKAITHPSNGFKNSGAGYFEDSLNVKIATEKTFHWAKLLMSRLVFFKLPPSMKVQPDNIAKLQNFFKKSAKQTHHMVWEPPVSWPLNIIERLSKSLEITPAVNPFARSPLPKVPIQYFRVGTLNKTQGQHTFKDHELKTLFKMCQGKLTYVVFNNGATSFRDAARFSELVESNHV